MFPYPGNQDELVQLRIRVNNPGKGILNLAVDEFVLELLEASCALAKDLEVVRALVVAEQGPVVAGLRVGRTKDSVVGGLEFPAVGCEVDLETHFCVSKFCDGEGWK